MTTGIQRTQRESAQRMKRCISSLLNTQSFFSTLALRLELTQDKSRKTIAADGERVRYNPEWVSTASADEIKAAVARVVLSCALKHHTRRNGRDYAKWQEASKLVTLPFLREANLTNQQGGLDMSIERAYETIPDTDDDDDGDDGDGDGGGGSMSISGKGGGGDQDGEDGEDGEDGDGDGDGDQEKQPQSKDSDGTGEIMDSPTKKGPGQKEELQRIEQDWDNAMHQAASIAKAEGNLPGYFAEKIGDAHKSEVDWRTILRRYMTAITNRDFSWARPNRRFIDSGLYLPSLHSEAMPFMVFAIDTSGSVDSAAINQIWSEVRDICNEVNPEYVEVIQCDTHVRSVERYSANDLPGELDILGRGGTAFSPVFKQVELSMEQPVCLVYGTDMGSSDYGPPPPYPVIWAAVDTWGPPTKPPFGEMVEVPHTKRGR